MKTMSKILATILIVVLCVSLFTVQAFAADKVKVEAKAPTCTANGYQEHWEDADTPGTWYTSADDTTGQPSSNFEIAATGHTLEDVAAKGATCMAEGNNAYKKCSVCGELFKADGTTPTTADAEKIDKVGHSADSGSKHAAVPPTCGDEGSVEYYICKWCGQKVSAVSDGAVLTTTVVPATGAHAWGDWSDVSPATSTKGGVKKRVCTKCGLEEYDTTDPLGVTANPAGSEIYPIIAERDTWFRGEELPMFTSELIRQLNAESGSRSNYVGVRIGNSQSLYANSYATLDFWSSGSTITLGEAMLRNLDAGTYKLWVYDVNNPNRHTNSINFYIVDMPTLEPINTDKHVINSTKNLRFRASEPVQAGSVKVGGKSLYDANYYYVSNDGLTITLSPDFLNERQAGTYTISANTVANGTKVSCPFYILSTASGSSASPKTADESQLGLWAAFLLLSGAAVVVLVPKIRKHGA